MGHCNALLEKLLSIPQSPGVYLFRNKSNQIIYIGKAKNLRHRLAQYAHGQDERLSAKIIIEEYGDVETVLTNNEVEALLLESSLIKKHQPQYNVMLKDDKTYPYIRLSMQDDYPRLSKVRKKLRDKARYFGPFIGERYVGQIIRLLQDAFRLRDCYDPMPKKVCLRYHIRKCPGPCVYSAIAEYYAGSVQKVLSILEGDYDVLASELNIEMQSAVKARKYESAAELRDQLNALGILKQQQGVQLDHNQNFDCWGSVITDAHGYLLLFVYRKGKLVAQHGFYLENDPDQSGIIRGMIEYYSENPIPQTIYFDSEQADTPALTEWLSAHAKHGVKLLVPLQGEKKEILRLVQKNARYRLVNRAVIPGTQMAPTALAAEIALTLSLNIPINNIECFDISNLGREFIVGSSVYFTAGKPNKNYYRHYEIRTVRGKPDDISAIKELVSRRLEQKIPLGDLLIIDGGLGHANAARAVLDQHGKAGTIVVGLAKKKEQIFFPGNPRPISLEDNLGVKRVITQIRNEAHRFANRLRTKQISKSLHKSKLDDIPGISDKMKERLLRAFGSEAELRTATTQEIRKVPGIGEKRATAVLNYLSVPGR